jgi:photosystem II stability/assembly factor-like uncharacterized protein
MSVVRRSNLLQTVALAALALLAVGCAGSPGHSGAARSTRPSPAQSARHRAVSAEASVDRQRPAFRPALLSAVSPRQLWVVSSGDCGTASCQDRLSVSHNAGRRWHSLPTPPARLGNGDQATATVDELTFADRRDGWLSGPTLWATHDGGRRWRRVRLPGEVQQLGVSEDDVWVVVGKCRADRGCSSYRLMRSPVDADRFTAVHLPVALGHGGAPPALGIRGGTVAVLSTLHPSSKADAADLELSTTNGATWTVHQTPCVRELGGQLSPAGSVVWAVCPTGSLAGAYRFDGETFTSEDIARGLPNAAQITAVSPTGAVVSVPGNKTFWTETIGHTWHRSRLPNHHSAFLTEASFPDSRFGYAIDSMPTTAMLLRTSDAGRRWTAVTSP